MAANCGRQYLPDMDGYDLTHFIKKVVKKICYFYDEEDFIDVTFKLSNPNAM